MPAVSTSSRAPLDPQRPWPGPDFFRPEEFSYFHGREQEKLELEQRLGRGVLTLVLGRSGLGKSSLVRAGLRPMVKALKLEPVYIRLQTAGKVHPVQRVRDELNRALKEQCLDGPVFEPQQTLWEYFHFRNAGWFNSQQELVLPVLVFDQFEEIFTADRANIEARNAAEEFWTQFADLLEDRLPASVASSGQTRAGFPVERALFKILICLRQDYLAELSVRRSQAPSLMQNHLLLRPFDGQNALMAVLGPGRALFPPALADHLAEQIVRRVWSEARLPSEQSKADSQAQQKLEDLRVEPALLSLFCQQLNEARLRLVPEDPGAALITPNLLDSQTGRIFDDFYIGSFQATEVKDVAEEAADFIETKLVGRTAQGVDRRDSESLEMIGPRLRPAIDYLVSTRRLLRIVGDDDPRVELIHDRLVPVVRAQCERREQRGKTRRRLAVAAAILAFLFLCLLGALALFQWERTNNLRLADAYEKLARETNLLAEVNSMLVGQTNQLSEANSKLTEQADRLQQVNRNLEETRKQLQDKQKELEQKIKELQASEAQLEASGEALTKASKDVEAERTRSELASRNFESLQNSVGGLLVELLKPQTKVNADDRTVQKMLGLAEGFLQSLPITNASDSAVLDRATTLKTFGTVWFSQGNSTNAVSSFRQAEGSLELLWSRQKGDLRIGVEFADCSEKMADGLRREDDLPGAITAVRRALDLHLALASAFPTNLDFLDGAFDDDVSIAEGLAATGDSAAASVAASDAEKFAEEIARKSPSDSAAMRAKLKTRWRLAALWMDLGLKDRAFSNEELARIALEQLANAEPTSEDYQALLTDFETNKTDEIYGLVNRKIREGNGLYNTNKMQAASEAYKEGLELAYHIAITTSDPDNQYALAYCYESDAGVKMEFRRFTEAGFELNRSLGIYEALAAQFPASEKFSIGPLSVRQRIVSLNREKGDRTNMLKALTAAIKGLDALDLSDYAKTDLLEWAALFRENAAVSYGDLRYPSQYLSNYAVARELFERLTRLDPTSARKEKLYNVNIAEGDIAVEANDTPQALQSFQRSLIVATNLAQGNQNYQQWVALGHEKIGDALRADGKLDSALPELGLALNIYESMAKTNAENLEWVREPCLVYVNIAKIHLQQQRTNDALADLKDAEEVLRGVEEKSRNSSNGNDIGELARRWRIVANTYRAARQPQLALSCSRKALDCRATLAATEGQPMQRQSWAQALQQYGDLLALVGKPDEATNQYALARSTYMALTENNPREEYLIGLARSCLLTRAFEAAKAAAQRALELNDQVIEARLMLAHASMFIGESSSALRIHSENKDKSLGEDLPWKTVVRDDFETFHKLNMICPQMTEIEGVLGIQPGP